jgi:nickel-dependent lactate racemase
MRSVKLAYGELGYDLALDLPGLLPEVLLPANPPPLPDPQAGFLDAVQFPHGSPPLAEVARRAFELPRAKGRLPSVVIAIADHTRPVPDRLLVPWIVQELGIPDECVTILVGTGTHRGSTPQELRKMLGAAADRFRVINHDCEATNDLVLLGTSSCGGPCWMNRHWVGADLRVATGFIEPHFYAGFSGGSKAVIPGIAGLETVRHFHRASLIAQPNATWARLADNPLQRLTREMTALCPPHFIVNVTLNRDKEITGIYAGNVTAAHDAGCAAATEEATIPVPRRYPVVVTTNSGYPLDQNFYQTVKGISAAARIVEPSGVILAVSRCNNGLPEEGEFAHILADPRPDLELHLAIQCAKTTQHDQWQVQTLLQCLEKARVILFSELPEKARALTRTSHTSDPAETLRQLAAAAGKPLPVAILPLGPLTVATVRENASPK